MPDSVDVLLTNNVLGNIRRSRSFIANEEASSKVSMRMLHIMFSSSHFQLISLLQKQALHFQQVYILVIRSKGVLFSRGVKMCVCFQRCNSFREVCFFSEGVNLWKRCVYLKRYIAFKRCTSKGRGGLILR